MSLVLAACAAARPTTPATPRLAPSVTVVVPDARTRVLAAFTREGIPVAASDVATVTSAPIDRQRFTAAGNVSATVEYFVRASFVGDTATLTLWSRASGDRVIPDRPVGETCGERRPCKTPLARMHAIAATLK